MHTTGPIALITHIHQTGTRQLPFAIWPLGSQTIRTIGAWGQLESLQHRICVHPTSHQAANGQTGFAPDEQGTLGAVQRLRYFIQRG
jgi:hypothetical protein